MMTCACVYVCVCVCVCLCDDIVACIAFVRALGCKNFNRKGAVEISIFIIYDYFELVAYLLIRIILKNPLTNRGKCV